MRWGVKAGKKRKKKKTEKMLRKKATRITHLARRAARADVTKEDIRAAVAVDVVALANNVTELKKKKGGKKA